MLQVCGVTKLNSVNYQVWICHQINPTVLRKCIFLVLPFHLKPQIHFSTFAPQKWIFDNVGWHYVKTTLAMPGIWEHLENKISPLKSCLWDRLLLSLWTLESEFRNNEGGSDLAAPGSGDSTVEEEIEDCQKEHWQNSHHWKYIIKLTIE